MTYEIVETTLVVPEKSLLYRLAMDKNTKKKTHNKKHNTIIMQTKRLMKQQI